MWSVCGCVNSRMSIFWICSSSIAAVTAFFASGAPVSIISTFPSCDCKMMQSPCSTSTTVMVMGGSSTVVDADGVGFGAGSMLWYAQPAKLQTINAAKMDIISLLVCGVFMAQWYPSAGKLASG